MAGTGQGWVRESDQGGWRQVREGGLGRQCMGLTRAGRQQERERAGL